MVVKPFFWSKTISFEESSRHKDILDVKMIIRQWAIIVALDPGSNPPTPEVSKPFAPSRSKSPESKRVIPKYLVLLVVAGLAFWCVRYVCHCTWISSMAYSQPSIVMSSQLRDGTRVIQDDFREDCLED